MPKRPMKRTTIGLALILAGFLAGILLTGRMRAATEMRAEQAAPPAASARPATLVTDAPMAAGTLPDFTTVAEQAVKGVVNISAVRTVRTPNSPFANDPMFQ